MKNFARLVRFAWPYRVRFGLSLACAAMVAVFWGGNIGAVYPLLQILIRSENCQHWIEEKIEATSVEALSLEARLEELEILTRLDVPNEEKQDRLARAVKAYDDASNKVLVILKGQIAIKDKEDHELLADLSRKKSPATPEERDRRIAEARREELLYALPQIRAGRYAELEVRKARWIRDRDEARTWNARYRWAEPLIRRYLPDNGFRTLLLLMGLVLVGIALKGLFLFLQEVLVADLTQLTLFDIRNLFYRRTMALDLASFSDQGSAELLARFTNDMDSVQQGLMTILGRVIREPLRIVACLGCALWLNWRLTCLALVLVPVSAACTYRAGKIMKRAVRRSLESMSNIYKILQESFQGIKVVKAYTTERQERRRFFLETKNLYKKSVKVAMIDALSDPVLEMLALITVSIALLSGSYLVLYHATAIDFWFFRLQLASRPLEIEDLLTLYAMLGGISDPVRKLANVHSKVQRAAAAADRIYALMDRRPEVAEKPRAVRLAPHRSAIKFDEVWLAIRN